ncbi:hypothetical protein QOZ84_09240 [Romboutsia sedimentorum]|uniref:Uncharacterized protein n=1 Tax=Romboutsia sedimentorum TaxID=1368474 RepID=A0ABT7E9Y3_9FIRM|nr:hypothetical protein [Romboutsia sedimentorum]MDK2563732.1 hypothetical protein [Romboutsia sedimentorum]
MKHVKNIGKLLGVAFIAKSADLPELIFYFNYVLDKVKKEGFLEFESELESDESINLFMKKGLQLAIDGVKPQDIRNTLELENVLFCWRDSSNYRYCGYCSRISLKF